VRFVSERLGAISSSFSEENRDSEGRRARRDVDRRSTSEVVTSMMGRPTVGIPSPACNGVINESGPCKYEYKKGPKMRAFGETANRDHWSVVCTLAGFPYELARETPT
jgi:hypothetical protein